MSGKYEKGIWVELIGFDQSKKDYGVKDFLDRMKEKPQMISLLLFSTQLLHFHTDPEKDFYIGDLQCSYYGRSHNEERKRQKWTSLQLRGLVDELHKYSIKILPSFFDMTVPEKTAESLQVKRMEKEWADEHNEVMYVTSDGDITSNIFPLKTLASGEKYEDFFIRQLLAFLKDYHFDGFHGCDGFGHPRFALCNGDFSEEMIKEFSSYVQKDFPPLPLPEMAEYILTSLRKEWSLFYAGKHASFWKKSVAALKKEGFSVFLNTCWTRDPFEALFRYGIDYRLLAECGIDGFFAEASSAVLELEGWNDTESSCMEKCQAMLMRIKASVPETKIHLLGCIKDGMEQYNALRHAPCRMRSEGYGLYNLFCNGKRCAEGILECLGDGITSGEWQIIDSIRTLAAETEAVFLPCGHIFWEESAFDREFAFYASTPGRERIASSHTLLHELIHAGTVLPSIMTFEALKKISAQKEDMLLVIHPAFLSMEAEKFLASYPGFVASTGLRKDGSSFAEIRKGKEILFQEKIQWKDSEKTKEEPSWLWKLQEKTVGNKDMLEVFAEKINLYSSFVLPEKEKEFLRVWCVKERDNKYRLFCRSEKSTYLDSVIRVKGKVTNCTALTEEPSRDVRMEYPGENEKTDTLLYARIPPYGTVILSITL